MEENGEHGYCLKQDCALGVGDIPPLDIPPLYRNTAVLHQYRCIAVGLVNLWTELNC